MKTIDAKRTATGWVVLMDVGGVSDWLPLPLTRAATDAQVARHVLARSTGPVAVCVLHDNGVGSTTWVRR